MRLIILSLAVSCVFTQINYDYSGNILLGTINRTSDASLIKVPFRFINYKTSIDKTLLKNASKRDIYGDYIVSTNKKDHDLAIKQAGDFLLYFNSPATNEVRELIKSRTIWDQFVEGNYKTAEPGLIFWTTMSKYSPSNYVGKPIICTNPCAEVPLEDGGACNLGSINLSRFVHNGF